MLFGETFNAASKGIQTEDKKKEQPTEDILIYNFQQSTRTIDVVSPKKDL